MITVLPIKPRPEVQARTPPPMAMLAELTHRCPLACPYCSNTLELARARDELSTQEWVRAFREAADLGVLHLHLSGGEPASRRDLVELTRAAVSFGLYVNLITSGIGLTERRVDELAAAGLDHAQLSIQGSTPAAADWISGYKGGLERKRMAADWLNKAGIALTINAVCHRHNMHQIEDMFDLAIELGARRIEIATVQFHGWAERNRSTLMPTRDQVKRADHVVEQARDRLKGVLVIDYVPADYHSSFPKACMGGWGRIGINLAPDGKALPCHAAETIRSLTFDNIREKSLTQIWYESDAFNAYRGEQWMQAPCRTCGRRHIDFGGCRCQAMALAGDPAAADPVCIHSPSRQALTQIVESEVNAAPPPFIYRGR